MRAKTAHSLEGVEDQVLVDRIQWHLLKGSNHSINIHNDTRQSFDFLTKRDSNRLPGEVSAAHLQRQQPCDLSGHCEAQHIRFSRQMCSDETRHCLMHR